MSCGGVYSWTPAPLFLHVFDQSERGKNTRSTHRMFPINVCVGVCLGTLVSGCHSVLVMFWSVSWPASVSACCLDHRVERRDSVDSWVVFVVVLHHAFDVEQFVSQRTTLFLLQLVVWRLQSRGSTEEAFNTTNNIQGLEWNQLFHNTKEWKCSQIFML